MKTRTLDEVERSEHTLRNRLALAEAEAEALRGKLEALIPPQAVSAAARAVVAVTAGGIPFSRPRRNGGGVTVNAMVVAQAAINAYEAAKRAASPTSLPKEGDHA